MGKKFKFKGMKVVETDDQFIVTYQKTMGTFKKIVDCERIVDKSELEEDEIVFLRNVCTKYEDNRSE